MRNRGGWNVTRLCYVCLFTASILFVSLSIQPFTHHRSGSSADLCCGAVPAPVVYSTVVQRYSTCQVATGDHSLYVQLPHMPRLSRQSLNEYCNISSLFAPPNSLRYSPSSFISNGTATAAANQSFPAQTAMR